MRVELLNGSKLNEVEERTRRVATAGMISHSDKSLFDLYDDRSDYEGNLKAIGRIVGSGHESITEHDQLTFAITEVTPIIEQILIGQRLASFTIKSRRYVNFSDSGFYKPDFDYLDNKKDILNKYNNHMNYLFDTYSKMLEKGVPKEDARFILPYCFHSEITMSINTRTLKKLIIYCTTSKMSKIKEVKDFGLKLLEIAKEKVPYYKKAFDKLEKEIEENKVQENKLEFLDKYNVKSKILKKPELISIHSDYNDDTFDVVDRTIIVSYIMNTYQLNFDKANKVYKMLSDKEQKEIMDVICTSREQRELEQVSFRYEIPTTLATLTHITRHRMHSLLIPDFLPMWDLNNYVIPDTVKENALDLYLDAYKENIKMYNYFKEHGVKEEDLVYFYLSGNMLNVTTNINGRELLTMSRLRCCKRAQWEVREIVRDMIKLVQDGSELYGNYLGAPCEIEGKCPEGKHSCGSPFVYRRK